MMLSGTNLPRVGTYNVNVVLSTIQASRGISRVEIAKRTGLTAQTVSVIVRRLIEQGIVEESGSVPSAGGKPRIALRINPAAAYAVGIHFDPIEISIVVVDMAGHPLAHSRQQIAFGSEPEVLITQAAKVVQRLLADLQIPEDRVLGVGAACPGPIDQDEGQVISLPRHDHWTDVPIKRLLTDYVGFDVIVDNDANAAAIGERWSGCGRDCSDFAFLYLGTGIGGAMFLSNHIYRGISQNAGEFGHIVVEPNGAPCYCGNRGCLEAMCTTASIVRDVRAELALGRVSSLSGLYQLGPELVDHAAIGLAAVQGDSVARRVVDRAADYIADCAVVVANVLDVDLIVLGGKGVTNVAGIYQERVAEALRTRPLPRRVHNVRVAISEIASDGAALGAATMVLHAAYTPDTASLTSLEA